MYSQEVLSLYDGGWRSADISQMVDEYNLTPEEAEEIFTQLVRLESEE